MIDLKELIEQFFDVVESSGVEIYWSSVKKKDKLNMNFSLGLDVIGCVQSRLDVRGS